MESQLVSGVRTTINDIKRGGWENVWGFDARELRKVLVQRDALLGRGGIRNCDGYAEDGVST